MMKEAEDQMKHGNFSVIPKTEIPEGAPVYSTVWTMRRKRDIATQVVKKWKARLAVDGSKMKKGVHYEESYAPVAKWHTICTLLTMVVLHKWHTVQLDYVQAYTQAPVRSEYYIKIPQGLEVDGNTDDFVLKVHRNIYGTKDAGRVWNKYLVDILVNKVGFTQSEVDECVFYKGKSMYVLYTDDSILAGPDQAELQEIIEQMENAKLEIMVEGDLQDFLGVKIDHKKDGSIHMTQPILSDQILKDLRLNDPKTKLRHTPTASSKLISVYTDCTT